MPIKYSFQGRLFRLDCISNYSTYDLKKAFSSAIKAPRFQTDSAFLVDVSKSISMRKIDPVEIRKAVDFIGPKVSGRGMRCAIVAPTDLFYGRMNIAVGFAEAYDIQTEVFRIESEALNWLGV